MSKSDAFERCACPHCDQEIEYPSTMAGERVHCPTCSGLMDLPEPESYCGSEESKGFFASVFQKIGDANERRRKRRGFHELLLEYARDGILDHEEESHLNKLRKEYGIDSIQISQWGFEILQVAYKAAKVDGYVSREEWANIRRIQKFLRVPDTDLGKMREEVERGWKISDLRHEPLAECYVPDFNAKPNEKPVWFEPARLFEERVVSRRYQGGSSSVRIRISKGVSLRLGGHRGHMTSERGVVEVSKGRFILTTKRLCFVGNKKSFQFSHDKVMSSEVAMDGIAIHQENREAPRYVIFDRNNGEFVDAVLSNLGIA